MTIRKGHYADLPGVYEVCHRTGDAGQDASGVVRDRSLLGQFFAAPYLVRDPDWCWIAADTEGVAGYLVTTPDTAAFDAWMEADWLPALRRLYPADAPGTFPKMETWLRQIIHSPKPPTPFLDPYPAHLHIDFLPRAQGQGLGTEFLRRFQEQLRARGVSGFHLGVGDNNPKALEFYRKQGLEEIERRPGVIYLGRRW